MRLSLRPRLRQIARCSQCEGTVAEHAEGCPVLRLKSLRDKQKHIHCPKCNEGSVDVNGKDLYECRGCNTQYCITWHPAATDEKVTLIIDEFAPMMGGSQTAYVLSEKGTGEFPNDQLIEELRQYLQSTEEKE